MHLDEEDAVFDDVSIEYDIYWCRLAEMNDEMNENDVKKTKNDVCHGSAKKNTQKKMLDGIPS